MKASVFIPAYECRDTIGLVIERLSNQTLPLSEYEIFVLDAGDITPDDLCIIEQSNRHIIKGKSYPELYNRAAEKAKGEIFLYLAAHCIPPKDWIENWIKEEGICGGEIKNAPSNNFIRQLEAKINIKVRKSRHELVGGSCIDYHNARIPKELYETNGGMNEKMRYVMCVSEFGARMHSQGMHSKITNNTVWHYNQRTLKDFSRGIFEEGYDKGLLHAEDNKLVEYFHLRKVNHIKTIKKIRYPIYFALTLGEYVFKGLYALAYLTRIIRIKEVTAHEATKFAHRRGQLAGIIGGMK